MIILNILFTIMIITILLLSFLVLIIEFNYLKGVI